MKRNWACTLICVLLAATVFTSCRSSATTPNTNSTPTGTASMDSISSASTTNYYSDSSLTKEQFLEDLTLGQTKPGTTTVATVNEDGSPNIAVVVPGAVDENTIVFSLSPNQTRRNFEKKKIAILAYYIYNPAAEDKAERNKGCRIIIELIEDQAAIAQYNEGKENSENNQYFKIVEVLPLG